MFFTRRQTFRTELNQSRAEKKKRAMTDFSYLLLRSRHRGRIPGPPQVGAGLVCFIFFRRQARLPQTFFCIRSLQIETGGRKMGPSRSAVRPLGKKNKTTPFPPFIFNGRLIDRSPVVQTAVEIDFSRSDAGKIRRREENKVTTESWWGRGGRRGFAAR